MGIAYFDNLTGIGIVVVVVFIFKDIDCSGIVSAIIVVTCTDEDTGAVGGDRIAEVIGIIKQKAIAGIAAFGDFLL